MKLTKLEVHVLKSPLAEPFEAGCVDVAQPDIGSCGPERTAFIAGCGFKARRSGPALAWDCGRWVGCRRKRSRPACQAPGP